MSSIKFGPVYTRIQDTVSIEQFALMVEQSRYDSIWVTDSLVTREPGLDCLGAVSAFLHNTKDIIVGSCVLLLPLRNPALLAKEVATLDLLSGGRVVLGVGSGGGAGGEARQAFEVCGISHSERAARCDEALEIIPKLWTGKPVTYMGRFYQFQSIVMEPRPVQLPHPPIWIGGDAEGVLKRVARYADGFVPVHLTPERYRDSIGRIKQYAEQFGRDLSRLTRALHLYLRLDDSLAEGERRANEAISRRYGWPVDLKPERGCAFGTPDDCLRVIEKYIDAGVEHLILNPACSRSEYVPQLQRFAEEVMGQFR